MDDSKRSKAEQNSYLTPPIAEPGLKRKVVNLPSERIKELLKTVEEFIAWEGAVMDIIAANAPHLVERIPTSPDVIYAKTERMYQQIRGKYNEDNRHRMRLSRAKHELGIPTIPQIRRQRIERDDYATRIVQEKLLDPQRPAAELAREMNENDPLPSIKRGLFDAPLPDPDNIDITALRAAVFAPEYEQKLKEVEKDVKDTNTDNDDSAEDSTLGIQKKPSE